MTSLLRRAEAEAEVRRLALRAFESGSGLDSLARRHGKVGSPIPVERPRATITHWFVPVSVGNKIAGYFFFDHGLRLHHYSSFLRGKDNVEAAPELASWTDPIRVRQTAGRLAGERQLGQPYLSYDGVPARLAWAVPASDNATETLVYVAGDYVYPA